MTQVSPATSFPPTPPLRRRLASFLYEGMLVFGIAFGTAFVYGIGTGQQHAMQGREGLIAALVLVIGVYFLWCWTRTGQTLAMQTWRLRVVGPDGRPPSLPRALARYLLSWLWFLPGLLTIHFMGWEHDRGRVGLTLGVGALLYACLSLLLPHRRFLHDLLSGTRVEAAATARRP